MLKNNIELMGFTVMLSKYVCQQTNEIRLSQKEMIELTGISKMTFIRYATQLQELSIFIIKYDDHDNRINKYYIHPMIYFQGKLNISFLACLLDIQQTISEPYTYLVMDENEAYNTIVNELFKPQDRYVYFIENQLNKEIKIGVTSNINKRMNTISSHIKAPLKLLKLIEGNEQTEKELHNKFNEYRLHGEWFEPSKELLTFINKL